MSYEVELISALKSNDINKLQESFKNIYEAYYKLVYFCVGNFLKNKEDIEDVGAHDVANSDGRVTLECANRADNQLRKRCTNANDDCTNNKCRDFESFGYHDSSINEPIGTKNDCCKAK